MNGSAIDVEELRQIESGFSIFRKFLSFFDRFLIDKFQIIPDSYYFVPIVEDHEYWARPIGNGKVLLMLDITKSDN